MATTRRNKINPVEVFRQHLGVKHEAGLLTKRADALKKTLKEFIPGAAAAYTNEQGSLFLDLDETIEVGGQPYKGMELRRSVPVKFDEEAAEKILTRKGVLEEAQSSYIDQEKIYTLLAQGKITEKDLDKMFVEGEAFAFWPVKGEVL